MKNVERKLLERLLKAAKTDECVEPVTDRKLRREKADAIVLAEEYLEEHKLLNECLISRLTRLEFESALLYLDGVNEDDAELIRVLARCFGDTGYMCGDMGEIVGAAVRFLIGDEEE